MQTKNQPVWLTSVQAKPPVIVVLLPVEPPVASVRPTFVQAKPPIVAGLTSVQAKPPVVAT